MREDMLCDFHKAVGNAITEGMSIQEFSKEFDSIVKRTGWQFNGTPTKRPEHKAWNNIVLPWDDPWWDKHTPPNGWGCRCWKEPVSALEVKALGLKVRSTAPTPPNDTKGIDKGWDYNVGNATWGKPGLDEK